MKFNNIIGIINNKFKKIEAGDLVHIWAIRTNTFWNQQSIGVVLVI